MEPQPNDPSLFETLSLLAGVAGFVISVVLSTIRLNDRRRRLKVRVEFTHPTQFDNEPEMVFIYVWNSGYRPMEVEDWDFRSRGGRSVTVPLSSSSPELRFPRMLEDGGGFHVAFTLDDVIDARDDDDPYRWFVVKLSGGREKTKRIDSRWPKTMSIKIRRKFRETRQRFQRWRWRRKKSAK